MNTKMEEYINDSIETKIRAKLWHHRDGAFRYFKNRHIGMAGIDESQTKDLFAFELRQYRIWKEIEKRCL